MSVKTPRAINSLETRSFVNFALRKRFLNTQTCDWGCCKTTVGSPNGRSREGRDEIVTRKGRELQLKKRQGTKEGTM